MTKYSLNTLWCYKYLDQSPASRAGMTEPCFGWQRRGSELGIVCSPAVLNFHSSETRSWESNVPSPFTPLSVNFSRIDPIFTHSMSFSSEPGCSCLSCYCGLWAAAWALLRINQTWPKSLWSPEFLAQEWYLEFLEEVAKDLPSQSCLSFTHQHFLLLRSTHHPTAPEKETTPFLKNPLLVEECCVLKVEILTEFLFRSGHLKKQICIFFWLRVWLQSWRVFLLNSSI